MSAKNNQIKSKERVRDQAEVFTNPREVKNILKLTQATDNIYWRFLEPACGNGNFLVEIVEQRLERIKQTPSYKSADRREFAILKMLSTIYGVDIAQDNIDEAKKRIKDIIFNYTPKKSSKAFLLTLERILDTNIQLGDMLNGKDKVFFVNYDFINSENLTKSKIKREVYALLDMEKGKSNCICKLAPTSPELLSTINFRAFYPIELNPAKQATLFNLEKANV